MKFIKGVIAFVKSILNKYEPIIKKCSDDNIFAIAGQSSFFMILSVVPLTAFIVSILNSLNIPVEFLEEGISGIFNEKVTSEINKFLSDFYDSSMGISLVSLVVTLWSASQGVHAITNGLNRIYDAYENRNWFVLRIRAMFYTIALFVLVMVSIVIIVLGRTINEWLSPFLLNLPQTISAIFHLRYLILFFILMTLFALIYRNIPNITKNEHKEYGLKYQLPGAFLCTVAWFVLSFAIAFYVDNFNGFSIYGSLTKLAGLMIWVYFCMICLMICAEINYVYHENIKNFKIRKIFSVFSKIRNKK
jgi:membrane protein